jgi:hypothetical protein
MAHSERDGSQPRAPHKSMGKFTENKGVTLDTGYEIRPVSAPPSQPATPVQPPASAINAPVSSSQGDAAVKE